MKSIRHFCGRIYRGTLLLLEKVRFYTLYYLSNIIYPHRTVYLFSERGHDARDNGWHMYRYFRTNYPDKEAYYVIDKISADRAKVEALGNVVNYGSLKHYFLFAGAKYRISSHIMGCSPNIKLYNKIQERSKIPGFNIFLQHGVIKNHHPVLCKDKTYVDLFICGAKPEFDFISNTFGYTDGEVVYTGLARYDGLQEFTVKRQILLMPTWRMYCAHLTETEFIQSDYFKNWNEVLQDVALQRLLQETNTQLVFYPHYEMQKFVHCFHVESSNVIIADFAHYDVQTLLKESALLVTDFSSVFFDFAYMEKPCIYFQFDKDAFENGHYQSGYFEYDSMGFGEVVETPQEVCALLKGYVESGFMMKLEYKGRANAFFPLHDGHNCERIYNEIEALK